MTTDVDTNDPLFHMPAEILEFIDNMGDIIYAHDLKGNYLSVNRYGAELYGYTREEYIQLSYNDIVAPEYVDLVKERLQRKLDGEETSSRPYELLTYSKSGEEIWVEIRSSLIYKHGKPCYVQGIARDISMRRRMENRLRDSEERLRRIFNNIEDVYYRVDTQGMIQSVSPSMQTVLGYDIMGLMDTCIADLYANDEDREHLLRATYENCVVYDYEINIRHKDGHVVPMSLNAHLLHDHNGDVCGIEGMARDITKRKQMEEDLMAARDQAMSASLAKTRFLSMMSHEVRTPLNGMVGLVDLLDTTVLDQEQANYVRVLRQVTGSMQHIVDEVLDYSKLEAGKMGLDMRQFNLHHLLQDTFKLAEFSATEKRLVVNLKQDKNLPEWVCTDSQKIGQILQNFISNAIKFTERGGIRISAKALEPAADGLIHVRLAVEDTGIGIARSKLGDIFRRFTQADQSTTRKYGGTGLGMAISQELANILGGQVGVKSHEGIGTLFWLDIPMEVVKPQGQATEPRS